MQKLLYAQNQISTADIVNKILAQKELEKITVIDSGSKIVKMLVWKQFEVIEGSNIFNI